MKPFREIHANDLQFYPLHEELKSSGYLLVRELIPRGDVDRVYADMVRVIDAGVGYCPVRARLTAWLIQRLRVSMVSRLSGR